MVKGEPISRCVRGEIQQLWHHVTLTELYFEDVASIIRLNPDDLVLMAHIQRFPQLLHNGYMEHSGSYIGNSVQGGMVPILLRNEIRPAETVLRRATSRDKDRGIINRNSYRLLYRRPQIG